MSAPGVPSNLTYEKIAITLRRATRGYLSFAGWRSFQCGRGNSPALASRHRRTRSDLRATRAAILLGGASVRTRARRGRSASCLRAAANRGQAAGD